MAIVRIVPAALAALMALAPCARGEEDTELGRIPYLVLAEGVAPEKVGAAVGGALSGTPDR